MITNLPKKIKINLEDYDFEKDIENRLLMATFSQHDLEVLEEVLNSSVNVSLDTLADNLDTTPDKILSSLDKIEKTGLFKREGQNLALDKEMRKYYEFQILKFEDDFKPSMDFLHGLLKKVPIHALPNWYLLPRTSDNIFQAIIEKFLQTPQVFRRYLNELTFTEEPLKLIAHEVYAAPGMKIRSKELREKFDLSREDFERYMLILEFSFLCCLSYQKVGDEWKEVVTPFYEWGHYLQSIQDLSPTPLKDTHAIELYQPSCFSFLNDMAKVLKKTSEDQKLPLSLQEELPILSSEQIQSFNFETFLPSEELTAYSSRLIKKICQTKMAEVMGNELHILNWGEEWLAMDQEDRAFNLYRHPLNKLLDGSFDEKIYPPRCVREVEKNLEVLAHNQWVYLDDFLKAITAEIGHSGHVKLEKKGRQWQYTLPEYNEEDFAFVKTILTQKLRRLGIVETGTLEGRMCLRLTDFAHRALTFHH